MTMPQDKTNTRFRFGNDIAKQLLHALGLEGRHVRRIELVFDIKEATTLTVYEYMNLDSGEQLATLLEMSDWKITKEEPMLPNSDGDVTSALDFMKRKANAKRPD